MSWRGTVKCITGTSSSRPAAAMEARGWRGTSHEGMEYGRREGDMCFLLGQCLLVMLTEPRPGHNPAISRYCCPNHFRRTRPYHANFSYIPHSFEICRRAYIFGKIDYLGRKTFQDSLAWSRGRRRGNYLVKRGTAVYINTWPAANSNALFSLVDMKPPSRLTIASLLQFSRRCYHLSHAGHPTHLR